MDTGLNGVVRGHTMKFVVSKYGFFVLLWVLCLPATAGSRVFEQGLDGYEGFADTSLYEERTENAGGGLPGLYSGTTGQGNNRRALIRVDLSAIPPGTPVLAARLELTVTRSSDFFGQFDFSLHQLTNDWGEGDVDDPDSSAGGTGGPAAAGDATWTDNFFTQSTWTTAGGDFDSTVSATASVGLENTVSIFESDGVVADVQTWIDGPEGNFGWILISAIEGEIKRAKRFASSESTTDKPRLVVLLDEGEDINSDSTIDAVDIQLVINGALGLDIGGLPADVNGDQQVNAVDVQLVINGALG